MIYFSQTIEERIGIFLISILEQINEEIVLPDIQRDFVWGERRIEKLYDSIMRGYPVGIILLWETYNNIQYRHFVKDYRSSKRYAFYENSQNKRLKLVLDGQQRLQSLYVSLYGSHNDRFLFFDILSGRETEDFREDKYIFRFFTPEEAVKANTKLLQSDKNDEEKERGFYYKLRDLMSMGTMERQRFKRDIAKKLNLSDEEELRLDLNLSRLRDALSSDPNILKATIIDEGIPRDSADRKCEADVLEAFIRINTEATRLTRSDLIFSMLKLNWKQSATRLPEFVDEINKGNSFELDYDFVIRCLFAVSDLGTKFDPDLLRKKSNVDKIRNNYDKCCDAIRSTVDFVQNQCWIASSKLLGGYFNLVPIVYYLFHIKSHLVPNSQIDNVRKALYIFGFTSPFSRYADSRLGKFIRRELKPRVGENEEFPLGDAVYWVWDWEHIENYGPQLVRGNPQLALHLVQGLSGAKVHYEKNSPQTDHIFPRSVLEEKGYEPAEINHFANFWILAKNKNQNKYRKHPKDYFADVSPSELKRAYIDKKLLDYRKYKTFLRKRESLILRHIKRKLNLTDKDYDVRAYYDID